MLRDSRWNCRTGETLIEALKREVFEETGITIEVCQLLSLNSNLKTKPGYNGVKTIPTLLVVDFICEDFTTSVVNSDENDAYRWVTLNEVQAMIRESMAFRLAHLIESRKVIHLVGYYLDEKGQIQVVEHQCVPQGTALGKDVLNAHHQ